MRRWVQVGMLALASCATPQPAPVVVADIAMGQARYLDQGWSAIDRTVFTTTAQGSHLIPLPWFKALRRVDRDEPFAGDQLQRYGYLPSASGLPVGFVTDGVAGDPQLGMTCAACHTGQIRFKGQVWRIDGGRANADFQAFLTDLGAAVRATLADPARLARFSAALPAPVDTAKLGQWSAAFDGFMTASLPDPAWGPGRLDAFGMIFNRVTALDLRHAENYGKADAPVRYPFIWDAPRQDRTQWTGAAPNGTYLRAMARNTGEVFGVFGMLDPTRLPLRQVRYTNSVDRAGLQTLEEHVVALKPPPWPREVFGLDTALASRGGQVFQTECASCHGATRSRLVTKAWNTVVKDVGTDPRAWANSQALASPQVLTGTQQPLLIGEVLADPSRKVSILANAVIGSLAEAALAQDIGIRRAIDRDLLDGRLPLIGAASRAAPTAAVTNATRDLYKAADTAPGAAYEARVLTGIWAVGPYLHNGSVPTLWELLKPASQRVTRFPVGDVEFDPAQVGPTVTPVPGQAMFTVDATKGNGNGGHEYGVALPEADRWAVIEYLKTL